MIETSKELLLSKHYVHYSISTLIQKGLTFFGLTWITMRHTSASFSHTHEQYFSRADDRSLMIETTWKHALRQTINIITTFGQETSKIIEKSSRKRGKKGIMTKSARDLHAAAC